MKKGNTVYYAQIMPTVPLFEVIELKIRTVNEDDLTDRWFVGIEPKTKHSYLFGFDSIGKTIFSDRNDALNLVKSAESSCGKKENNEKYYEEY